jgi:hypothetical protein
VSNSIIADARLFSTILEGKVLEIWFAVEKELKEWGKIELPESSGLEEIVAAMGDERIRMNYKFIPATLLKLL